MIDNYLRFSCKVIGNDYAWTTVGLFKLFSYSKLSTSSLIGKCLNLVLPLVGAMYYFSFFDIEIFWLFIYCQITLIIIN